MSRISMIEKFIHFANPKVEIDLYKVYNDFLISNIDANLLTVIMKGVCEFYNVSVSSVESKIKKREIVTARYNYYKLAKDNTKESLRSIGLNCGGRDHSTVLTGINTFNDLCLWEKDTNERYLQCNDYIQTLIKAHSEKHKPQPSRANWA